MLGLYLHIPFCSAICNYCNFNRGLLDEALKRRYVDALEREIRSAPRRAADTIFFGGGTPSLLDPAEIVTSLREGVEIDSVLSNSFGFGGTNATLVMSKYLG